MLPSIPNANFVSVANIVALYIGNSAVLSSLAISGTTIGILLTEKARKPE